MWNNQSGFSLAGMPVEFTQMMTRLSGVLLTGAFFLGGMTASAHKRNGRKPCLRKHSFPAIHMVRMARPVKCRKTASRRSGVVKKLHFGHTVRVLGQGRSRQVKVRLLSGGGICYLKRSWLRRVSYRRRRCPDSKRLKAMAFLKLKTLVKGKLPPRRRYRKLGLLFPTFYNIAVEREFPGPRSGAGKLRRPVTVQGVRKKLATVSLAFYKALIMQGTGELKDGRIINYWNRRKGKRRFKVLRRGSYGWGIKGHRLYPYRSAAVHFRTLAGRAGLRRSQSNKMIGTLLYLPRLKGALLPDGNRHDGFLCAVDVGSAIHSDRIDLFVGLSGGGSPYSLPCCRHNAYTRHGIKTLDPSDWQRRRKRKGRWVRSDKYEYRRTARAKGLAAYLVPGMKCYKKVRPAML